MHPNERYLLIQIGDFIVAAYPMQNNPNIMIQNGNIVPDTSIPVNIKVEGNGSVIGSGNAGYNDMKSFRSLTPDTFRGKAIVIVQPEEKAGKIELTVSAEGLADSHIEIETY